MKYILITDLEGNLVIIPLDNIAYVAHHETTTRIYLRHVAGTGDQLWYVLTKLSVKDVADFIDDEA